MTKTETIQLDDEVAVDLAGHHDAVLDAVRARAGCGVTLRGNELTLSGDDWAVDRGRQLVTELVEISVGGTPLTPDVVKVVEVGAGLRSNVPLPPANATSGTNTPTTPRDATSAGDSQRSPAVSAPGAASSHGSNAKQSRPKAQAGHRNTFPSTEPRREGERPSAKQVFNDVVLTHRGKAIGPRSAGQKEYVDTIRSNSITFGIGPAGTGKTYLAMALAVEALVERRVARIVLCRPAVEAGERLGFLPGSLLDKVDPYLRPLYDALYDMMDPDRLTTCMEQGIIEVAPLAFMRGRTLNDAFVVLDEAQNTTPEQMQMFLTRLGFGSKMVVTGDPTQIDLQRGQTSGLNDINVILRNIDDIGFVQFDQADVQRHRLVQRIVAAYQTRKENEETVQA
ncbi:MAG: Phosphate starvation-inducible protein PhoH [Thermoleophilia bacterium]|nr:Phosphate starvation-inducible protein PhoH [Thermoleophilia bacterium]